MKYIIWSIEHKAWWNANYAGYTNKRSQAGLYEFEEACAIVQGANEHLGDATPPHEAMILVVESKNPKLQFWAYLHQNGQVIVKRWFGDVKDYTDDVEGNDFVQRVVRPFAAASHEEAEKIALQKLESQV